MFRARGAALSLARGAAQLSDITFRLLQPALMDCPGLELRCVEHCLDQQDP